MKYLLSSAVLAGLAFVAFQIVIFMLGLGEV